MKKLIHFLQTGRLVNVDNYSVYTIASVLKKFLRKIPNGIFGREVESQLFKIIEIEDKIEQQTKIHRYVFDLSCSNFSLFNGFLYTKTQHDFSTTKNVYLFVYISKIKNKMNGNGETKGKMIQIKKK